MNAPVANRPILARFGQRKDGHTVHLNDVYDAAERALDREIEPSMLHRHWAEAVLQNLGALPADIADAVAKVLGRTDVSEIMTQAMAGAVPPPNDLAVAAIDAVLDDQLIRLVTTDEDIDVAMIESATAELHGGRIANALTDLSRSCAGLKNLEDLVVPR